MALRRRAPGWKRLAWRYPEWWALALCVAAWLVLVGQAVAGMMGEGEPHLHHHGTAVVTAEQRSVLAQWMAQTLAWALMAAAMMLPMMIGAIRGVAARSLWARRDRAVAGFLGGYLGVWVLVGGVVSLLVVALGLDSAGGSSLGVLAVFGLAALWQVGPVKRRAVRTCHQTVPLAPRGLRADRDCVAYGWMIGGRCVLSCWALMLALMLTGHGPLSMLIGTGLGMAERYQERPDQRVMLAGIAALAGIALLGTVV